MLLRGCERRKPGNSLQLTYWALVESYRSAAGERLGRLKRTEKWGMGFGGRNLGA
jgi:hypothetical protein